MTDTGKTNRDMNGFSRQKVYRILNTREKNTSTPSRDHEQQPRLPPPTKTHASSSGEERCPRHKRSKLPLRLQYELSTYTYGIKYEKSRIPTIGKYKDAYVLTSKIVT